MCKVNRSFRESQAVFQTEALPSFDIVNSVSGGRDGIRTRKPLGRLILSQIRRPFRHSPVITRYYQLFVVIIHRSREPLTTSLPSTLPSHPCTSDRNSVSYSGYPCVARAAPRRRKDRSLSRRFYRSYRSSRRSIREGGTAGTCSKRSLVPRHSEPGTTGWQSLYVSASRS